MSVGRLVRIVIFWCLLALAAGPLPAAQAAPTASGETATAAASGRAKAKSLTRTLQRATTDVDVPSRARRSQSVVQISESPVDAAVGVVGVTLESAASGVEVFVRQVSATSTGEWSAVPLDPASNEPGATKVGTDPIVVSDAEKVQVAVVAPTAVQAQLSVVTSPVVAADAVASDIAWTNPEIRSRKAWGADESLVKNRYTYAQVTGAMIHHTAGTNSYTAAQVPSILRSIQAYHVNGRGWNDTAYNVLVDKFGRAWEGRGGGVELAVQGGHGYGVTNARTMGIALMGDYQVARPSDVMLDTAERVIAWKFRRHGVDPYGTTYGSGGQDGGSTFLNAISGHRDENATSCPGQYVYSRFAEIRSKVATYMNTVFKDVPSTAVIAQFTAHWQRNGGATGWLGAPVGDVVCGRAGGCVQNFRGGTIYSKAGRALVTTRGAIHDTYRATGGETGRLGYPTGDETCAGGVCRQPFEKGVIAWSASAGAHVVSGTIGELWTSLNHERGPLGVPQTGEICGLPQGGCYQHFQGGSIYWSPATGAQSIVGAIHERWAGLGWERGWLGYPVMDEECGLPNGGCYQHFQNGSIYWSDASGAHPVGGAIRDHWARQRYERGPLGYPLTGELANGVGVVQRFQGGAVYWAPGRGVYVD